MLDFSNSKSKKKRSFITLIFILLMSLSIYIYHMKHMPNQSAVDNLQTTVIYEQNISHPPRILQTISEFPIAQSLTQTHTVGLLGSNTFVVTYDVSDGSNIIYAQILYANGTKIT